MASDISLHDDKGLYSTGGRIPITIGDTEVAAFEADGTGTGWANVLGGSHSVKKQTVVLFGDSITADHQVNQNSYAAGFFNQANTMLGQRFLVIANSGVSGNRTDQMLARIQTDVIAYAPGYCVVEGGVNDIAQQTTGSVKDANGVVITAASIESYLSQIWTNLIAAGIRVVATTIPPSTNISTANQKSMLAAVNLWIRQTAQATDDVILCDWNAATSDPATGNPATNMTSDGVVHPSQTGGYYMGLQLAKVLHPVARQNAPLPWSNADEDANMLPNPRFTGNTAGVADSTTINKNSGTPTLTKSKVTRTDGIQGEWQQVAISGATDFTYVQQQTAQNVGAGDLNVGDWIYAVCEVEIDPGATMVGANGETPVSLGVINQDAPGAPAFYTMYAASSEGTYPGPVPSGRMVLRTSNYQLPTGSSRLFCRTRFYVNGTIRVGRMQVYKAATAGLYGN